MTENSPAQRLVFSYVEVYGHAVQPASKHNILFRRISGLFAATFDHSVRNAQPPGTIEITDGPPVSIYQSSCVPVSFSLLNHDWNAVVQW